MRTLSRHGAGPGVERGARAPLHLAVRALFEGLRLWLAVPSLRRRLRRAQARLGAALAAAWQEGSRPGEGEPGPAPGGIEGLLAARRLVEIDLAMLAGSRGRPPAASVLAPLRRRLLAARLRALDTRIGAAATREDVPPGSPAHAALAARQACQRALIEGEARRGAAFERARCALALPFSGTGRPRRRAPQPLPSAPSRPGPDHPAARPGLPLAGPPPPAGQPLTLTELAGAAAAPNGQWRPPPAPTRRREGAAGAAWQLRLAGRAVARKARAVVVALADPPQGRTPFRLARPLAGALCLALLAGGLLALPAAAVLGRSVKAAASGLPRLEHLERSPLAERTEVFDRNGRRIGVLMEENRVLVPLERVPKHVRDAVVAAEDARFYEHEGVDTRGILRAALTNVASGQTAQGGSTITQQYVRNAYPGLKDDTIARKIKEASLATQLERKWTKDQILEGYLNVVYFGEGFYGIEAAAQGYFGVHVDKLNLAQAATLAGIIRSPVSANPIDHPEAAQRLRDRVLDRMVEEGMVEQEQAERAKRQPLQVRPLRLPGGSYVLQYVQEQLLNDPRLGATREERRRQLFRGGLRINTTFDWRLQRAAEEAVKRHLPSVSGLSMALAAIDPRTGHVLAMVGGPGFEKDKFNRATQAWRPPGSSFKAFVLAAALENGISPDSVWESGTFNATLCGITTPWEANNYEGDGSGPMTLREATHRSVNGVYARIMAELCPEKVADMAHRLGVPEIGKNDSQARHPSIALGAGEVRVIDMASAYATLAALGVKRQPVAYTEVRRHGRTLFTNQPKEEQAVEPILAYEVIEVLKGVVQNGTGTAASIGRPQFGKTGTSQDYQDAWFVGATPQLSVAVWMGYDTPKTMAYVGGRRYVTGGSFPAIVWRDFAQQAFTITGEPPVDWQRPSGQLNYTVLPPEPPREECRSLPFPLPPGFPCPGDGDGGRDDDGRRGRRGGGGGGNGGFPGFPGFP